MEFLVKGGIPIGIITTMVDIAPSGSPLLIIALSGAKSSICLDSWLYSLEKK